MSKKTVGTMQVLTEAEKFFIKAQVDAGEGLAKIVLAVGKSEALIKEHIATLKPKKPKSQFEIARGKDQTSVSGKAKVAVANQGMSEASDELRKTLQGGDAFKMKYAKNIAKAREE